MTIADKTEQLLKCTLQNNVQFVLNDKIIREGKMIIYNVKDFYITFNFINPKGIQKVYEIPVPFDIVKKDNDLIHTLMGNDVGPRKDFIIENAINVSNLDI